MPENVIRMPPRKRLGEVDADYRDRVRIWVRDQSWKGAPPSALPSTPSEHEAEIAPAAVSGGER